jgi:gamma-glutamylcyclotransferase (GGCT)/AIG2-like uncharacterized protein YtfP
MLPVRAISNSQLVMLTSQVLTSLAEEESYILGELYALKNENECSWAMEQLDDYEGVNPEEGEVAMYKRSTATVYCGTNITTAWIYWFNGEVTDQPLIASGDVLRFIQQKSKL